MIFTGHLAPVNAVAWSPDGTLIASGSDDTFVQVFEASTGKRRAIYTGHTKEVAAVAWSPNGRLIASAGQDGTVQIWDITGRKILTYTGHSNRVNSVAWSTDGLFMVSGSEDRTVQVWNSRTGIRVFNFVGHTAGVLCVGWQPNNSSVASGSWDGTLRDWATVQHGDHFAAGKQIFNYGGHIPGEVLGLTWAPNGNFIASAGADQTVQISIVSDIKNGGTPLVPFFTDHRDPRQINPVRTVDWSPGGNDIVSGDTEGKVLVWHAVGRKTFFTYQGHKKAVNSVAWAPDGKRIASAVTTGRLDSHAKACYGASRQKKTQEGPADQPLRGRVGDRDRSRRGQRFAWEQHNRRAGRGPGTRLDRPQPELPYQPLPAGE